MSQGCAWLMTCSKPLCVCVCAVRCNQRHLPGGHSQDHHGLSQHESVYSLFNFLLLVISAFSCPAITSMVDWHYKPVIYLSVILKVQAIENIQLRGIHKPPPCGVMQSPSHWTWKKKDSGSPHVIILSHNWKKHLPCWTLIQSMLRHQGTWKKLLPDQLLFLWRTLPQDRVACTHSRLSPAPSPSGTASLKLLPQPHLWPSCSPEFRDIWWSNNSITCSY